LLEVHNRSGNWEFDLESNRVYASDGALNVYGIKKMEWTITDIQKIALPEYRGFLDQALQKLVKKRT
jgi:hypothetical protein